MLFKRIQVGDIRTEFILATEEDILQELALVLGKQIKILKVKKNRRSIKSDRMDHMEKGAAIGKPKSINIGSKKIC